MPLSHRKRRFVEEYCRDWNGAAAAERAGYGKERAKRTAWDLRQEPEVEAGIRDRIDELTRQADIDDARIWLEMRRLAFSNPRRLFTADGRLKMPHELDDDTAASIASIEVVTKRIDEGEVEYIHKIKQWPKFDPLNTLGKARGLWSDRQEHTGRGGGPIEHVTHIDEFHDSTPAPLPTRDEPEQR